MKFFFVDASWREAHGPRLGSVAANGAATLTLILLGDYNPEPLLELKIDDFKRQIDVNLTGQLIVTQAFALLLGVDRFAQGRAGRRIVMISSTGGKVAFPFMGAYSASKFALEGMSKSLRPIRSPS